MRVLLVHAPRAIIPELLTCWLRRGIVVQWRTKKGLKWHEKT